MNTKTVESPEERKDLKRAARKKAPAKPKRAPGVSRGEGKKRIRKATQGTRKR